MADQKPMLAYATPRKQRWPWWADVAFGVPVAALVIYFVYFVVLMLGGF